MSTPSTNDNPRGATESNIEFAPAPKKFVFDIPNNEINEKDNNKRLPNSRNLWLLKCLPIIHEFKRPENVTEAYDRIIQNLLNLYKEIRDLILADCLQSLKEVLKDQKIRDPVECLQFIKTVVVKTYGTAKELSQIDDISKTAQEYEKLLQKSEDKIRELIRNEQIYRISFDQFAVKDEEAEKNLSELQIKLNGNQETIEKLNKETSELKLLLQKKDEEIQSLLSTRQSHNNYNQSKFIVTPSETCRSEYHKPKAQSLASQNLKTFLKNNKPTPSDDSHKATIFDLSKILNSSKNPNSKTPQASTARALQTSGNMFDFSQINLKAYKLNNSATKIKDVRDRIKNFGETSTERRRLESSGDLTLNNSSRLPEWQSSLKHSKRVSSQKGENSQTKAKSKSPVRSKTKREWNEGDEKSLATGRFRPYEDLSLFLVRTEPSQDQHYFLPAEIKDKTKEKECEYQLKASICKGYNTNTKKKGNSSKSKFESSDFIANSREKASESKGSMHNKQAGSSAATYRSTSKGQSQVTEQKEDVKNVKPNTSLVNVMLKKLAEKNGIFKK